ncbi:hypothetical protein TNCV_130751 [Trichonephila clavipes]|nr:hypothetical protein TNCV_130751 [Trichonephila clavipes]
MHRGRFSGHPEGLRSLAASPLDERKVTLRSLNPTALAATPLIRATVIPPLHGPGGMAYSDFEKAEAFKDTLEVTFRKAEAQKKMLNPTVTTRSKKSKM